jgi:hypothetical protein
MFGRADATPCRPEFLADLDLLEDEAGGVEALATALGTSPRSVQRWRAGAEVTPLVERAVAAHAAVVRARQDASQAPRPAPLGQVVDPAPESQPEGKPRSVAGRVVDVVRQALTPQDRLVRVKTSRGVERVDAFRAARWLASGEGAEPDTPWTAEEAGRIWAAHRERQQPVMPLVIGGADLEAQPRERFGRQGAGDRPRFSGGGRWFR